MVYFYLIIFIVSAIAFIADIVLRTVEKIKSFNFNKKLFNIDNDTIPVDKFFPENLTILFIALMGTGTAGSLYSLTVLPWWLSLLCALASGMFICFIVQYLGKNIVDALKRNRLPKGEKALGLSGCCVEEIKDGEPGKVRFFHKTREFIVNAASANDTNIEITEKVVCVYESDGFYFVTKSEELYKGIDTNF